MSHPSSSPRKKSRTERRSNVLEFHVFVQVLGYVQGSLGCGCWSMRQGSLCSSRTSFRSRLSVSLVGLGLRASSAPARCEAASRALGPEAP